MRDRLNYLANQHSIQGDVARFTLGNQKCISIGNVGVAKAVLGNSEQFPKPESLRTLRLVMGDGLLLCKESEHSVQRSLFSKPFSRSQLNLSRHKICDLVFSSLANTNDLQPSFDAYNFFSQLTLTIILDFLGVALCPLNAKELLERVTTLEKSVDRREKLEMLPFMSPLLAMDPIFGMRIKRLRSSFGRAVQELRQDSFLNGLVQVRGEKFVHDQIATFVLAGYETTATSLTWIFYFLAKYPQLQSAIRNELKANSFDRFGSESLALLKPSGGLLDAAIFESLRMCPAVYATTRQCKSSCTAMGVDFTPDEVILISPFVIQRNPNYFEDPHVFAASRWIGAEKKKSIQQLLSFGYGSRVCIGQSLAIMEMRLCVATMLLMYGEIRCDVNELTFRPAVTLKPSRRITLTCLA